MHVLKIPYILEGLLTFHHRRVSNAHFPLQNALWARGRTIAAFNEALSDPERATSDALIQAVGLLALHEHIYGDRVLAHKAHRVAQQRCVTRLPHPWKQGLSELTKFR